MRARKGGIGTMGANPTSGPGLAARVSFAAAVCLASLAAQVPRASAGEFVVTQKYALAQVDDTEGTRDVVQKLYFGKDKIKIDDEVETVLIDLKAETIATYRHKPKKTCVKETFAERRAKIEDDKASLRSELKDVVAEKQREKLKKMYRYLLDDDRRYAIEWPGGEKGETKNLAGVDCRRACIRDDQGNVVYEGYVHPEIELPYDSAEVLYLLQIIGKKLADTLKSDPRFKKLPMALTLTLARGGELKAEVTGIESVEAIAPKDFAEPEGYRLITRPRPGDRIKDPNPD